MNQVKGKYLSVSLRAAWCFFAQRFKAGSERIINFNVATYVIMLGVAMCGIQDTLWCAGCVRVTGAP